MCMVTPELVEVTVMPFAFEPLANRLTVLELCMPGATLRGAAAAIAAHLSGSLRRLNVQVSSRIMTLTDLKHHRSARPC